MLAEFKYGLEPKESFEDFFDQSKSHRRVSRFLYLILSTNPSIRLFYHLKKVIRLLVHNEMRFAEKETRIFSHMSTGIIW